MSAPPKVPPWHALPLMVRIDVLCAYRGWNADDFAAYAGLNKATFWRWRTERTSPTPRALRAVAGAFDITIDELCDGLSRRRFQVL